MMDRAIARSPSGGCESGSDHAAENLAALLVVGELVVAGAGRREHHHVARSGEPAGNTNRLGERGHPLGDGPPAPFNTSDYFFIDLRARLAVARSEEHTSELPAPNTKSYAVFRLKKKNN